MHHYVRVHVCTSSIQWEIQYNPCQSTWTTKMKQQRHGASETSRNDKLRVAWEGMGNMRAGRAITANRAANMHTLHHYVRVDVCTVYINVFYTFCTHTVVLIYFLNKSTRGQFFYPT